MDWSQGGVTPNSQGGVTPNAHSDAFIEGEVGVLIGIVGGVLFSSVNTLMAGGGAYAIDRSTDTGDAALLILAAVDVAMVVLVWVRERRTRITT